MEDSPIENLISTTYVDGIGQHLNFLFEVGIHLLMHVENEDILTP